MTEEKSQQDIPGNPANAATIQMRSQNTIVDQFLRAFGLSAGTTMIRVAVRSQFVSIQPLPQFYMGGLDF